MNKSLEKIAERILSAKSVAIFTHANPDGDAIGCSLALCSALAQKGIKAQLCVDSDLPARFAFVDGADVFAKKPTAEYDLLVCLDCADPQRLGGLFEEFYVAERKRIDTISIDHHAANTGFAKYDFVRRCAANCLNVATLIEYLGASFDKKTAEYLLLGLLTDSGNFSHDDVDEEAFLLAAKLTKAGADVCGFEYNLFKKQSKARAKLFAKVMNGMRFYHDDRFAAVVVTQEMLAACGADSTMTEGFVDFPLNIDGVEVAASLLERKRGQYRISIRTKMYADANKIAGVYGGGGHVRAAGCMLFGDIEDVLDRLSYTVSQYLE